MLFHFCCTTTLVHSESSNLISPFRNGTSLGVMNSDMDIFRKCSNGTLTSPMTSNQTYRNARAELHMIEKVSLFIDRNKGRSVTVEFILHSQRLAKKQRIIWFLIHDSKQHMKNVFLDSLIRTSESNTYFISCFESRTSWFFVSLSISERNCHF